MIQQFRISCAWFKYMISDILLERTEIWALFSSRITHAMQFHTVLQADRWIYYMEFSLALSHKVVTSEYHARQSNPRSIWAGTSPAEVHGNLSVEELWKQLIFRKFLGAHHLLKNTLCKLTSKYVRDLLTNAIHLRAQKHIVALKKKIEKKFFKMVWKATSQEERHLTLRKMHNELANQAHTEENILVRWKTLLK